jgi:hypothetical protein
MSKCLDHREFGYLAGTDVMLQMLRNKTAIMTDRERERYQYQLPGWINMMDDLIGQLKDYLAINAQGFYYFYSDYPGCIVYTEHAVDRDAVRDMVQVTLATIALSAWNDPQKEKASS